MPKRTTEIQEFMGNLAQHIKSQSLGEDMGFEEQTDFLKRLSEIADMYVLERVESGGLTENARDALECAATEVSPWTPEMKKTLYLLQRSGISHTHIAPIIDMIKPESYETVVTRNASIGKTSRLHDNHGVDFIVKKSPAQSESDSSCVVEPLLPSAPSGLIITDADLAAGEEMEAWLTGEAGIRRVRTCATEGCDKPPAPGKGYCEEHAAGLYQTPQERSRRDKYVASVARSIR